jgi:hypothetical protein
MLRVVDEVGTQRRRVHLSGYVTGYLRANGTSRQSLSILYHGCQNRGQEELENDETHLG